MSDSRAFGKHVVVMIIATAAFCIALTGLTTLSADSANAAPYPPTEPCTVTATARGAAAADGTSEYDVLGSGLGSVQPVRVVLATTGQQIGSAQTDTSGSFRTTVTAPPDADTTAPDFTASSPQQTCTWTPPTQSAPPTPPAPTAATPSVRPPSANSQGATPGAGGQAGGTGTTGGQGTGGEGTGGSGSGAPGSGGSAGPGSPDATGSATGSPVPSSTPATPAPSGSTSLLPPLAEPSPGSDTPFGIGLGIAAVLLVLGTLAVLLLTRRPER